MRDIGFTNNWLAYKVSHVVDKGTSHINTYNYHNKRFMSHNPNQAPILFLGTSGSGHRYLMNALMKVLLRNEVSQLLKIPFNCALEETYKDDKFSEFKRTDGWKAKRIGPQWFINTPGIDQVNFWNDIALLKMLQEGGYFKIVFVIDSTKDSENQRIWFQRIKSVFPEIWSGKQNYDRFSVIHNKEDRSSELKSTMVARPTIRQLNYNMNGYDHRFDEELDRIRKYVLRLCDLGRRRIRELSDMGIPHFNKKIQENELVKSRCSFYSKWFF